MKRHRIGFLSTFALLLLLASCNSIIYDEEGDCTVTNKLQFVYDKNMKFADAFKHEVTSVSLYAFDKTTGKLAWQTTDKGDALAQDGYAITLPLSAGDYDLVAWCGLDNETSEESFTVKQMTVGTSTCADLSCSLNRKHDNDGKAYTDSYLYPLFHGQLSLSLPNRDDGGEYTYKMPLTKDTNHLRIILQHLSGKDVDVSKFSFTLEDENGLLDYNNEPMDDEAIAYHEWNKESGAAGVETNGNAQTSIKVAIADLTVSRLMVDHKVYLTIRNADNKVVLKIPFIDYALLVKGKYNEDIDDQDYLDRQDEYSMTFFLDEKDDWNDAFIYINSWRVVLSNVDL